MDNPLKSDGRVAIEVLAIKLVTKKNRPLILVNIYSRGCCLETLNGLSKQIDKWTIKEPCDILITGDFNAHHPAWGSTNSDAAGKGVVDWLDSQDLVLLNDGSPTRFDSGGFTHIDLTVTSPNLATTSAWGTAPDSLGSDHYPQLVTINNWLGHGNSTQGGDNIKFNYKKADWSKFRDLCTNLSLADVHSQNPNTFCNNLTSKIMSIAGDSVPASSAPSKLKKQVPWLNELCYKAVQDRKKALKLFKKNPVEQNLRNYRSLENSAKRVILDAKTQN